MDIISHGLWGVALSDRKTTWPYFFLSGSFPDLISSGPGFVYLLFVKGVFWSSSTWSLLPTWVQQIYFFSHSLLATFVIFILIILFRGSKILLLPFLFHIFLDIFTHAGNPINRLIFPFQINNNFYVNINWWENHWLSIINWILLLAYLLWQYKKTR